jgi:hypothetical protein
LLQTLKNEKKKNNGFTNQLASFGNCTLLAAQDEFLLYFFRGWYKAAMVVETDYYFQIMRLMVVSIYSRQPNFLLIGYQFEPHFI